MSSKPFWSSKTVWFNGLTIIIALATALGFTPNQALFVKVTSALVGIAPVVNLLLRFVTKDPISLK